MDQKQRTSLCISRKLNEAVLVGTSRIQIIECSGRVRMRITADREVPIVREELANKPRKG